MDWQALAAVVTALVGLPVAVRELTATSRLERMAKALGEAAQHAGTGTPAGRAIHHAALDAGLRLAVRQMVPPRLAHWIGTAVAGAVWYSLAGADKARLGETMERALSVSGEVPHWYWVAVDVLAFLMFFGGLLGSMVFEAFMRDRRDALFSAGLTGSFEEAVAQGRRRTAATPGREKSKGGGKKGQGPGPRPEAGDQDPA